MRQVILPTTLKVLGDDAFSGCKELKRVTFGEGSRLEEIGSRCFSGSGVEEITIPGGVTVICERAFSECKALRKVSFQEGSKLERIEKMCFAESSLEEIEVPRTLRAINAYAFENCEHLKAISVEDCCECSFSSTRIFGSSNVISLRQTQASGRPLVELRQLKEIVVPDGTHVIGSYWFWGSSIESVTIPGDFRKIGVEAFCNCKRLKKLTFRKSAAKRNLAANSPNQLDEH